MQQLINYWKNNGKVIFYNSNIMAQLVVSVKIIIDNYLQVSWLYCHAHT
jgi:hypothetical protein